MRQSRFYSRSDSFLSRPDPGVPTLVTLVMVFESFHRHPNRCMPLEIHMTLRSDQFTFDDISGPSGLTVRTGP